MTTSQTESTQTQSGGSSLPTSIVVGVCVLSGLVLAGAITLLVIGRPLDSLMTVVASVIVPTIAALLAAKKLGDITPVLRDVSIKVNGRLDSALNAIKALEAQVSASGQTPITHTNVSALPPMPRHSAENPTVPTPVPVSQEVTANNG